MASFYFNHKNYCSNIKICFKIISKNLFFYYWIIKIDSIRQDVKINF
jgi:hypothetical protein